MGGGIAQIAALAGIEVVLYDAASGAAAAVDGIAARLAGQIEKGRITADERDAAIFGAGARAHRQPRQLTPAPHPARPGAQRRSLHRHDDPAPNE